MLSWRQSADVSLMMTTGAKAGQMHTAMTNLVAEQHEAAGEDPLAYKLPDGGIEGVFVCAHACVRTRSHPAHLRPRMLPCFMSCILLTQECSEKRINNLPWTCVTSTTTRGHTA